MRRYATLLVLLVGTGLAGSCHAVTVPDEPPYVRGTITSLAPDGRVLVAEPSDEACGGALVSVNRSTDILWEGGGRAARADLRVGTTVEVWTTGVELRSCPPQVTATVIVVVPTAAPHGNPGS